MTMPEHLLDRYEEALRKIAQWADAYPLQVFPEPKAHQLAMAADVLAGVGLTLDAISASILRHAIEGVGKIARDALGEQR
jgi:hypothetical protein